MLKAIQKGDGDALRKALSSGDVNAIVKNGQTGLALAILSEDIEMVDIFLETKGVNVNLPGVDGLTPLMQAISSEASSSLRLKSDLFARDKDGQYAVHHAAASPSQWALKFLKEVPKNILDMRSYSMKTPLHVAVEIDNMDAIDVLLERNVEVNTHDETGNTALIKAILRKSTACALRLLQGGADPKLVSKDGNTALHIACLQGCSDLLLRKVQETGLTMETLNARGETAQQILDARNVQKRMEADLEREKKQQAIDEKASRKRTRQQEAVANSPLTELLEENDLGSFADWLASKRYKSVDDLRDLTFDKLRKAGIGNIEERNRLLGLVAQEDERRTEEERLREEEERKRRAEEEGETEERGKRNKILMTIIFVSFLAFLYFVMEIMISIK